MRATSPEEDSLRDRLPGYGRFLDPQAGPVAELAPPPPPLSDASRGWRSVDGVAGPVRPPNTQPRSVRFDYSTQPASAPAVRQADAGKRPRRPGALDREAPTAAADKAAWGRLRLVAIALALVAVLALMVPVARRVAAWPLFTLAPQELIVAVGRGTVSTGEVRVYPAGPVRSLMNAVAGPPRVGLQVGHLDAAAQPDELASLRFSTGAHHAGFDEVVMNERIVTALAERLRAAGVTVDVLPATVPPNYSADLVLSVHVDSSTEASRGGYKSAHFVPARNAREPLLKVAVDRALLSVPGFTDDDRNVSGNMLEYYAFNDSAFEHSVAGPTPALIVELGYLSNPADLRLLQERDTLVDALTSGVLAYLTEVGRRPR